ncbi:Tryptophan--tRNA ligase, cytoplasmic [Fonsecaea nubica]|uniref:Tryptophan--tRNA ligase, cytoplasmic n=1 Tax=Fonsecaea nubica TaxID=856822 RepID=A0A178C1B9_9EURO|nr:Tryptophan--tRNA ligase, cytoplasmic [Fonsecaea nubica]OAL23700.1 Tryptophan--tRNA ligase, cytoplasmic [Fonsecaea nubica]
MSLFFSGKIGETVLNATAGTPGSQTVAGFQPNPCSFDLLNVAIDTNIGIPILIGILKTLTIGLRYTPLANPPESSSRRLCNILLFHVASSTYSCSCSEEYNVTSVPYLVIQRDGKTLETLRAADVDKRLGLLHIQAFRLAGRVGAEAIEELNERLAKLIKAA